MIKTEIAVISDIHGNSIALKEVLNDIKSRGINTIINLGDSLYGPLDSKGTFDLIIENNIKSISGNQDRFILENLKKESDSETLEFVKSQINSKIIEWLKSLYFDLIFNESLYCCHGTPQNDTLYLLEDLHENYVTVKQETELEKTLIDIQQNIVICAHSHVSRVVKTKTKTIINAGSVGCPAYHDDLPIYHKMENFSPHARYVILKPHKSSIIVEQVSLDYDFEQAAKIAGTNNRPDWVNWIRTGIA
jgi:predicted phosphodiesterase